MQSKEELIEAMKKVEEKLGKGLSTLEEVEKVFFGYVEKKYKEEKEKGEK